MIINPHTLGHRLLWLITHPDVRTTDGYAGLPTLQICCMPDVWPDHTAAALTELAERGVVKESFRYDLTRYALNDAGKAELERLGAWTYEGETR